MKQMVNITALSNYFIIYHFFYLDVVCGFYFTFTDHEMNKSCEAKG